MTSGSGWASPARPERSAIPPALSAQPSRWRNQSSAITASAYRHFLMRGFDPVSDATEFGRELIPRIESGAAEIDDESGRVR